MEPLSSEQGNIADKRSRAKEEALMKPVSNSWHYHWLFTSTGGGYLSPWSLR